jgi:hypothetical protein
MKNPLSGVLATLILCVIALWLLWEFAYYNENLVIPNERSVENILESQYAYSANICDYAELDPSCISTLVIMYYVGEEVSYPANTYIATSPSDFVEQVSKNACIYALPLHPRGQKYFSGQKTYLTEYESVGDYEYALWTENYNLPGWTTVKATNEEITYNRNNSGLIISLSLAIAMIKIFYVLCVFCSPKSTKQGFKSCNLRRR